MERIGCLGSINNNNTFFYSHELCFTKVSNIAHTFILHIVLIWHSVVILHTVIILHTVLILQLKVKQVSLLYKQSQTTNCRHIFLWPGNHIEATEKSKYGISLDNAFTYCYCPCKTYTQFVTLVTQREQKYR